MDREHRRVRRFHVFQGKHCHSRYVQGSANEPSEVHGARVPHLIHTTGTDPYWHRNRRIAAPHFLSVLRFGNWNMTDSELNSSTAVNVGLLTDRHNERRLVRPAATLHTGVANIDFAGSELSEERIGNAHLVSRQIGCSSEFAQ